MKDYQNNDINTFFEEFKDMPESLKIEQVHQLINNPGAKAMRSGIFKLNHLKLIIMTSAFIVGISALIMWLNPGKTEKMILSTDNTKNSSEYYTRPENDNETDKKVMLIPSTKATSKPNHTIKYQLSESELNSSNDTIAETQNVKAKEGCSWPVDTVIEKKSLIVYLSEEELKDIGITMKEKALFYENTAKSGKGYIACTYNWKADKWGKPEKTNYKFYLEDNSDTLCTSHRWGHPFYSKIDTLVPVYVKLENDSRFFWFTANSEFFNALPKKYAYMKSIFENLKCLKKQNPNHQFVNYWSLSRNIILDKINYLELTNEELRNIGIEIYPDSISLMDSSKSFTYCRNKNRFDGGTHSYNGSVPPQIPDMFPSLITDIKGLKQQSFGKWIKEQNTNLLNNESFNTLIPVLLPLSELISGKDFNLVLWYYPTENFLNALPEEIGTKLKGEISYLKTGISNENSTCTYFEACKSTLEIENLKVYPNPANQTININFSLPEVGNGSISLVNISGQLIKTLIAKEYFSSTNFFQADISDIAPGVYLISINTEKGFKTQRIIISR